MKINRQWGPRPNQPILSFRSNPKYDIALLTETESINPYAQDESQDVRGGNRSQTGSFCTTDASD